MGLFDRLRGLDKSLQELKESVLGQGTRAVAGVDWPRPSDPDGIDVLAAVELAGLPYRVRSEGADASGWEYRQHEVVVSYDSVPEWRNKSRTTLVTWVEALHRPYYDDLDRYTLRDRYGTHLLWRSDPPELASGGQPIVDVPYLTGTVPSTGDPCWLLAVGPLVVRLRGGSMDIRGNLTPYGENANLRDVALQVLARIDRGAVERWVAAVEPWRGRFDTQEGSTGSSMLQSAIDGARGALGAEGARRGQGEDAKGGGLLGRVLGAAEQGAGAALARRVVTGTAGTGPLPGALQNAAERRAARKADRFANAAIVHLDVAERAQPGERRVALGDDELSAAVSAATGVAATYRHDRITAEYDCRYLTLDGGSAVAVAFRPGDQLDEAREEVEEAKTVGGFTIGTSADQWKRTTNVAVGPVGGLTLTVRADGPTSPMTALKIAKAVAGLLDR